MKKLLLLSLLLLCGCFKNYSSVTEVMGDCKFGGSKFSPEKTVSVMNDSFSYVRSLIATASNKSDFGFQITFREADWVFFNSCSNDNGEKLATMRTDSRVISGNNLIEEVTGFLAKKYVESKSSTGFELQCCGKRGCRVVEFPALEVQGFLKCVEKLN